MKALNRTELESEHEASQTSGKKPLGGGVSHTSFSRTFQNVRGCALQMVSSSKAAELGHLNGRTNAGTGSLQDLQIDICHLDPVQRQGPTRSFKARLKTQEVMYKIPTSGFA